MSVNPGYNVSTASVQYVSAFADPEASAFFGTRYILADLRQKTLSFDTRLNMTFTPTLTLELYAQPFISSVHYKNFKQFAAPRTQDLQVFGRDVGTIANTTDASGTVTGYAIDPDGSGPAGTINLSNPDFNFRSLRGNAVLRWEYRPGSTLFLVWTRTGSDFAQYVGDFGLKRDLDQMLQAKADNIFLVKLNFWLNR
jgi:hypothetical protein